MCEFLNFCYYVCFWKCTHSFNLWEVRQNRCIALWNGQDSNWSTVGWIFKSTVRKSLTFLLYLKLSNETSRETNILEKQNASGSHSVCFWVLLKIYLFKWKKERWNKQTKSQGINFVQKENKTVESLGSKVWKKKSTYLMLSNLKMKEWLDWVVPSERAVSLCLKDIWKITKPSSWTISKVRETAFFCLLQISLSIQI